MATTAPVALEATMRNDPARDGNRREHSMPMRVVYDPQIPHEVARKLAKADISKLIPFSTTQRKPDAALREMSITQFFVGSMVCMALLYVVFFSGPGAPLSLMLEPLTLFGLVMSALVWQRWREGTSRPRTALLRKYHRRYVVPGVDLDSESNQMWWRASRAADTITGSNVFKEHADWERISSVLPGWLWEIAEGLALLSEVRARQREILSGQNSRDPEFAEILDQQRRARDTAVADIERKVGRLERLAGWAAKADDAVRKAEAIQELAALNDSHTDLLARVDNTDAIDAHETEVLGYDFQAIIAQADEAARQAIEDANDLTPPDK
jgi:hypothetical protein